MRLWSHLLLLGNLDQVLGCPLGLLFSKLIESLVRGLLMVPGRLEHLFTFGTDRRLESIFSKLLLPHHEQLALFLFHCGDSFWVSVGCGRSRRLRRVDRWREFALLEDLLLDLPLLGLYVSLASLFMFVQSFAPVLFYTGHHLLTHLAHRFRLESTLGVVLLVWTLNVHLPTFFLLREIGE